jgi:hypothetical protein
MYTLYGNHFIWRCKYLADAGKQPSDSLLTEADEGRTIVLVSRLRERLLKVLQSDLEEGLIKLATHTEKMLATPASGWPASLYNYAEYSLEDRVEYVRLVNAALRTGDEIKIEYDETAKANKLIYYHDSKLREFAHMLGLNQQELLNKAKNVAEGDDRVLVMLMFGDEKPVLCG